VIGPVSGQRRGNVRRVIGVLFGLQCEPGHGLYVGYQLGNVEFVQALVTPSGSPGETWVLRWTVRFIIAILPVAVLLIVQISSLRLQHWVVNGVHHVAVLLDLVLLV